MDRRGEIGGGTGGSSGAVTAKSPYPGLRSFAREEADVFFGRDRCISGMTETLQDTRFLAVLGPSGSGKSSLVRSGLFMHLEAGLARKAGSRWTFLDIKHPRTTPFTELARLTLESERPGPLSGAAPEPARAEVEERRKSLSRDPFSLVRWWTGRPDRHPEENLLLLVDQFEELFGYSTDRERNEVEAFIDLLLESAGQDKVPVYVVITMRSEFLGGCSLFPGLAEQINASLSLTPRMTREECREAITGPAFGGDLVLEDVLVTAILNDMNSLARFDEPGEEGEADSEAPEISQADLIARRADQLPLMQHVLNWMWNIQAHGPDARPGEPIRLTLEQYLALGRLRGAMNLHADDVMAGTGDPEAVARIFRARTDQPTVATSGSAESSAVRRRRTVAQLAEEADVHPDRVRAIVDAYRAEGVSMLNPDPETYPKLEDGDEVDISHESLIRQWGALRGWIREEGEAGRSWQELLRDVEKGTLLTGLDLAERRGWWDRAQPHAGWAERYSGRFGEVDEVMKSSIRRDQRRKALRRAFAGSAVVLAIASYFWAADNVRAQREAEDKVELARLAVKESEALAARADRVREKAESEAADARKQRAAARREAEEAKRAADAAKIAAAAAARQVQLASVQVSRARAEGAAIKQRSDQLSHRIAERTESQLSRILTKSPADSVATVGEMIDDLKLLQDADPPAYAAIRPEFERNIGELAALRIDTAEMLTQADVVRRSVSASAGADRERDAVRLSQASLLQGRAERLRGEESAALASFEAAAAAAGEGTEPARLARADAQYEKAGLLFDMGKDADALAAARQCLDTLPQKAGEEFIGRQMGMLSDEDKSPAKLRSVSRTLFNQFRCESVLGLVTPSETDASEHLQSAALNMMLAASASAGLDQRGEDEMFAAAGADMSLARSDLIVRYFRRPRKPLGNEFPEELSFALGSAFTGLYTSEGEEGTGVNVDADRFHPLDALARVEANNAVMRWYADLAGASEIPLADALMIMKINQGLLPAIQRGVAEPAMVSRISAAFLAHGENWLSLYDRLDSVSGEEVDSAFSQAAATITKHWAFLSSATPDRVPAADRSALEKRVRDQARMLVEAARQRVLFERYGSLLARGKGFFDQMCGSSESTLEECVALATAVADVRTQTASSVAQVPASTRPEAAGETVWTDDAGVALGGRDPVTCVDGASALRRTARDRQQSLDQANAARECTFRMGRLRHALRRGDHVWLFESQENLNRFDLGSARYVPRLGGYDLFEMKASSKLKQGSSTVKGAVINQRFYLTQSYRNVDEVTAADIRQAEENWEKLKSVPEVDPSAVDPLSDVSMDMTADPGVGNPAAAASDSPAPDEAPPSPDPTSSDQAEPEARP